MVTCFEALPVFCETVPYIVKGKNEISVTRVKCEHHVFREYQHGVGHCSVEWMTCLAFPFGEGDVFVLTFRKRKSQRGEKQRKKKSQQKPNALP